ncbi:fumarylacetoacetate hydrolase family protein [Ralstonia holmesii]|uniref:fumarylacetoacetate hydrolase family protein n=1 Tax=Ralstonia TaxID=48736 RepID=UPI00046AC52A|nr:fumarylacetoacetate hydrolase family protein [Ralstonia pickettii]
MKLVRVGTPGAERPGLIDTQGRVRDLSGVVSELGPQQLSDAALVQLAGVDIAALPVVPDTRFGVPWTGIGKIIAIGLNYADHAAEAGLPPPAEPILFLKANSALNGPNDAVMLPRGSEKTDWEVELGVVIGKTASDVSREEALSHVAGYCVVNDVSEREFQLERGGTWDKGKGCDTFCPVGPWLVTRDEVPDPQALGLWLDVNGERAQRGNTATMVFGVAHLVSYVSRFMTLHPGDLICTGTPPGVGMGAKPPRYLSAGDTMRLGIDGLGVQTQTQTQTVAAYTKA